MIFQKKLIFLHICVIFCIFFNKNIVRLTKAATVDNYYETFDKITYLAQYEKHISSAATAIDDFIQEFYIKQNLYFDIIVAGNVSNVILSLITEIGKRSHGRYSTNVKWISKVHKRDFFLNDSAIIFSAAEDFHETFSDHAGLENNFVKDFKFLHYCHYCFEYSFAHNHKGYTQGSIDQFQYFLIHSKDEIKLATHEWWNDNNCNNRSRNFMNTFNISTMKWQKEFKYVEKFTNFHGCPLPYSIFSDKPIYNSYTGKNTSHMVEIFETIAKMSNFTSVYVDFDDYIEIIKVDRDEARFPFKVLLRKLYLSNSDISNSHIGGTISDTYVKFIIPPGALYTPYEKVLLPFDEQTWWFLIATFGGAFGIIFMINLLPKKVKDIIFGENVHVPAFNVIGTFFGIGQLKLPENNFARIILMTFILFCLVIRTAYQGVQFDMMTKEMRRKPTVQSYQQILDEKYKIWVAEGSDLFGVIKNIDGEQILKDLMDPTFDIKKSCYFGPSDHEVFIHNDVMIKFLLQSCDKRPVILDEVYLSLPVGIGTFRNHFILPALEKMFQLTTPFGIPQYHYKLYCQDLIEPATEDDGPKVLFIGDLSFGFVIWLVACGVCLCVFFSELLTNFLRKKTPVAENNLTNQIEADSNHSQQTLILNVFVENINEIELNKNVKVATKKAQKRQHKNQDKVIENQNQNEIVKVQEINFQTSVEEIFGEKICANKNEKLTEIASIESKTLKVNAKSASSEVTAIKNCKDQPDEIKNDTIAKRISRESKEIDDEIDEIENLIQDFETEMEKPRKVLTDEEILEVAMDFSDIELDI